MHQMCLKPGFEANQCKSQMKNVLLKCKKAIKTCAEMESKFNAHCIQLFLELFIENKCHPILNVTLK